MPFYEYRCEACGHDFEAMQKISDPVLTECPECHEPKLKKLVSAAGFRLKGGGWYETDFKSGNKKNLHGGSGESKSSSDKPAKTESKPKSSDAKPAAKSAT